MTVNLRTETRVLFVEETYFLGLFTSSSVSQPTEFQILSKVLFRAHYSITYNENIGLKKSPSSL